VLPKRLVQVGPLEEQQEPASPMHLKRGQFETVGTGAGVGVGGGAACDILSLL